MKLKKIISAFAATTMVVASFATIASADATIEWSTSDDVYYVTNLDGVADRTPAIEVVSVKQMTSNEVVALGEANNSSISKLKLKASDGKYGDTNTYTMYQIDAKFTGVGDLVMGYDPETGNSAAIRLMALDATLDLNSGWDSIVDCGILLQADATTGVTWTKPTGINTAKKTYQVLLQLGTDNAYPKEDTAEGGVVNAEYPFTVYVVLNKGAQVTIPFSADNASVQYLTDGMKQVFVPANSFTLKEASAEKPAAEATLEKLSTSPNADNKYTQGFLATGTATADTKAIKGVTFALTRVEDNATDSISHTFGTEITAGTVKVAVNIVNVDADATITCVPSFN